MTMQDHAFIHLQICDDPDSRLNESQPEKISQIHVPYFTFVRQAGH